MLVAIRIRGKVGLNDDVKNALYRLRLRRKYACVLIREKPELVGMLNKLRNFIAYGHIDEKTLKKLIEKRGISLDKKKINADEVVKELLKGKPEKSLADLRLKPFFRLHPPRGGIDSKKHFPKGVLGNHKEEINKLVERML